MIRKQKDFMDVLFSITVTPGIEYISDPIGTINVEKLVQGSEKIFVIT
jgi:hypothetical protein